jgi:hypothetical protein
VGGWAGGAPGPGALGMTAGWLWALTLRPILVNPLQRRVGCPRGHHRCGRLVADELIGSRDALDYPELAICQLCGDTLKWPNGKPTPLQG